MSFQSLWTDRLAAPLAADHLAQLYDRPRCLVEAVTLFASTGLRAGEGIVVVAAPVHVGAIEQGLKDEGFDVPGLRARGQLGVLDAADTLSRLMVGGWPDATRLDEVAGRAVEAARQAGSTGRVRVYGEMVNLLWRGRDLLAAMRLEDLWNDLVAARQTPLLCGYRVGREAGGIPPSLMRLHLGVIPATACA